MMPYLTRTMDLEARTQRELRPQPLDAGPVV
jgi:hypothetical protein